MLTEKQELFIDLSKRAEVAAETLKTLNAEKDRIALELGIGSHFQDPKDKTVFQIIVPNGAFMTYKKVAYERTKREGEFKGTLSVKKAKELGYGL